MKLLIASLLALYVIAALFVLAGYAAGKIKHRFTGILCLVAIASVPFFVFLRFSVRKIDDLPAIAMPVILFAILAVAGYMMGRHASFRSIFLARVTVCISLLIVSTHWVLQWGYSTNMVNAGFEHQDHARIGHWEFSLPSRWYQDRNVSALNLLFQLGAKEAFELHRASWSAVRDQSVFALLHPCPQSLHCISKKSAWCKINGFRLSASMGAVR